MHFFVFRPITRITDSVVPELNGSVSYDSFQFSIELWNSQLKFSFLISALPNKEQTKKKSDSFNYASLILTFGSPCVLVFSPQKFS